MKRELIQTIARAYRRRVNEKLSTYKTFKTKRKGSLMSWVGIEAQKVWAALDLPKNTAIQTDIIGAVSTLGDPRQTDVLLASRNAQFEVKTSDYRNTRTRDQLAAQVFDLGLGTAGADALYRIYAQEGRIDVFTREDAAKAVAVALRAGGEFETPSPSYSISMDKALKLNEAERVIEEVRLDLDRTIRSMSREIETLQEKNRALTLEMKAMHEDLDHRAAISVEKLAAYHKLVERQTTEIGSLKKQLGQSLDTTRGLHTDSSRGR